MNYVCSTQFCRLNMSTDPHSNSYQKTLCEFCSDTTAHGLGRAASAKSWPVRAFWLAAFTVAFVVCTHQIVMLAKYFLKHPIKTLVKEIYEDGLSFPAVTVCNTNPFRLSKVKKTPIWKTLVSTWSCPVSNPKKLAFSRYGLHSWTILFKVFL